MAPNPLLRSINDAVHTNRELGNLFAKAGGEAHPRGRVVTSYRLALSAIQANPSPESVREITLNLKDNVTAASRELLRSADELGRVSASRQLDFYGDQVVPVDTDWISIEEAVKAISASIEAQTQAAVGLAMLGSDPVLIIGDDDRKGVLRDSAVTLALAFWLATLANRGYSNVLTASGITDAQKQAIAVLDARTTDCCLQVHGQVAEFDKPFELTGTPRFADELDGPPFHWWCRTAPVLYRESFDLGLTQRLRDGAAFLLSERAAGRNPDQHPANAFWS